MATRADFWMGCGKDAEWLGSVAFDGYEWAENDNETNPIATADTPEAYRAAVAEMLDTRDDATLPGMGWPWPWDTSDTTDYAYYFHDGKMRWGDREDWPDMSARRGLAMGTKRDSIMIFAG